MRVLGAAALLAAAVLASGCAADEATTTTTQPVEGPLVTYERAGGIVFTAQRLVVDADGSATLTIKGAGRMHADFDIAEDELDELRAALDAATLTSDSKPVVCADCYSYSIDYGGEEASFDQTKIPPPTEPAIGLLEEIVAREST